MIYQKGLYVKKRDKPGQEWSSVLTDQFHFLHNLSNGNFELFEIDTASVFSFLKSAVKLAVKLFKNDYTLIYVNHIICAYPSLLGIFWFKGEKVLALHESEPVLGWRFALKNSSQFSNKVLLRYTKLFSYPLRFFDRILVLNQKQTTIYRKSYNFIQLNYLGVNSDFFKCSVKATCDTVTLLFPHDPSRFEKGAIFFENMVEVLRKDNSDIQVAKGGKLSRYQMLNQYCRSDIVYLTGYYETYSLVLLEAMSCNKFIVVSENIGLADNFLTHYCKEELEEYGIFVVSQTVKDLLEVSTKLIDLVRSEVSARSREFLFKEELSEERVNKRLLNVLMRFES